MISNECPQPDKELINNNSGDKADGIQGGHGWDRRYIITEYRASTSSTTNWYSYQPLAETLHRLQISHRVYKIKLILYTVLINFSGIKTYIQRFFLSIYAAHSSYFHIVIPGPVSSIKTLWICERTFKLGTYSDSLFSSANKTSSANLIILLFHLYRFIHTVSI